jgi:formamidopyrimidine-DNA glycosylase
MPELPDVEHARKNLHRWLRGARIVSARSKDARILRPGSGAAFARALNGHRVVEVERRGKWLRIELDGGGRLFSHLGMTGDWVKLDVGAASQPSERARFEVKKGNRTSSVRYLDARRFGRLVVARDDIPEWTELGPDPLHEGISATSLAQVFASRKRTVKEVLMDQSVLAGVGNILAIDALWRARLDPRSRSDALSKTQIGAVVRALRAVIKRELADLERDDGEIRFDVYGRAGKPCPRCKTTLSHIVLGGRGTTFCSGCQIRAPRTDPPAARAARRNRRPPPRAR